MWKDIALTVGGVIKQMPKKLIDIFLLMCPLHLNGLNK